MITSKQIHDQCTVSVEWLDPSENMAYAKLVCTDPNCTRKKKWIQWLSLDDAITLTEDMGIAQLNKPIPLKMISTEELGI
jgi:hypothetical protein